MSRTVSVIVVIASVLSLIQAQGRIQAVVPVRRQIPVQAPARTTQAAPGPNSSWQSVSWLQNRQRSERSSRPENSAQKPALLVVSVQRQPSLLGLHGMFSRSVQVSVLAEQMPLL